MLRRTIDVEVRESDFEWSRSHGESPLIRAIGRQLKPDWICDVSLKWVWLRAVNSGAEFRIRLPEDAGNLHRVWLFGHRPSTLPFRFQIQPTGLLTRAFLKDDE